MDVSIVIVSYNVSDLLNGCIVSIKRETKCSYEIIVVDNNSNDNSVEMLKTCHPDVRLIQNEMNVGFAKANNQAFKKAKGRYFLMLNPDTIVLDSAIDKLIKFMDEHLEAGACGPKNLNPDMTLQHNCHHFPTLYTRLVYHLQLTRFFPRNKLFGREHMTYWDYNEIKAVDSITGCSLMIRKTALDVVGLLDENYFMYTEETDLCFRLKKAKWKTVFYPDAAIIHYGGQSALNQKKEKVFAKSIITYLFTTRYYFFKKHYGYTSYIILKLIDFLYYSFIFIKNIFRSNKIIRKAKMEASATVLTLIFSRQSKKN
ncbi:MAG: glycosyltransferase family 2 protein [Candidatus Brocadia sp.]|nr:glycosyltransferase family 2 protein [Candidatus Brocadia sp.]